ncbi:MAG: glycosyltransferase, partial [Bifidobacteriaceae bacterium]|nr:glycosyltransferase [Bifidobacteriaceae bacterium]
MTICDPALAASARQPPAPGTAAARGAWEDAQTLDDAARSRRVALVSFHTSPLALPGVGDAGGMNVYLSWVSRALAEAGWEVDVYTRATTPEQAARGCEPIGGATLRYLRAGPAEPLEKSALAPLAGAFAAAMAAGPRADVVHSHYWLSGLAGAAVARGWGATHVQSLHTVAAMKNRDLAPGDTPEGAERLAGERRLALAAEAVVTVSEAERDAIVRAYGVDRSRLRVIQPGVDGTVFHPGPGPAPESLPPALRRPAGYLLMAGRVQPIKGQDLAIRALAGLPAEGRPALLVTGAPGQGHLEYAAGLRVLARRLGVEGDVVFLGPRPAPRLAELIRGAR